MSLPTIEEVVRHVEGLTDEQVTHLTSALTAREDNMADMFRMAGLQFGLYPQIVSEVFAEVGIGTPISEQQRVLIRQQFTALMQELQQQYGQGGS
jgi:hypothetical protein